MLCVDCGKGMMSERGAVCSSCRQARAESDRKERISGPVKPFSEYTLSPAPFTPRFVAFLVDVVGLLFVALVLDLAFFNALLAPVDGGLRPALGAPTRLCVFALSSFVLSLLYFVGFELSSKHGTPGKRLMGLVVTDREGFPLPPFQAVGRYFGRFVGALPIAPALALYLSREDVALAVLVPFFLLGLFLFLVTYPISLFTELRQGLHDIIGGSVVQMERRPSADLIAGALVLSGGLALGCPLTIGHFLRVGAEQAPTRMTAVSEAFQSCLKSERGPAVRRNDFVPQICQTLMSSCAADPLGPSCAGLVNLFRSRSGNRE